MNNIYYIVGIIVVWGILLCAIGLLILWLIWNDYFRIKINHTGIGYRYWDLKWCPTLKDKDGNILVDIRLTQTEFPSLRYFEITKLPYVELWFIKPKKELK